MIIDHFGLADHLTDWMVNYAKQAYATTWVLGLSGGIDSALCAQLAKRTGMPLACVNMPCHSSPSAFDRANAFAEEEGLKLFKVDLGDAHASIAKQFQDQAARHNVHNQDWNHVGVAGALRSCLRAPTLSYLAHATSGLIVGTGNRSEDHITRYFQKFGDGCVDMSPIADLWKSEVSDLFQFLAREKTGTMSPGAEAIFKAKPSADLWGSDSGQEDEKELGISYDEIEWADREDIRTSGEMDFEVSVGAPAGIIFNEQAPSKYSKWSAYTPRQQEILTKLHRMEKVSRHKSNPNMPVCDVRRTGFVK